MLILVTEFIDFAVFVIEPTSSLYVVRPKVDPCKPPSSTAPLVCKDIVLPNPSSRKSFEPWSGGPSKPCYRKKTKYGVYVGLQSLPDTSAVDEETIRPWDNDTWIPPGGIFLKYTPSP